MPLEERIRASRRIPGTIVRIDDFITPSNHECAFVINRVWWYALRIVVYDPPYRRLEEKLIIEKISEHFSEGEAQQKSREIRGNFNNNLYNLTSTSFLPLVPLPWQEQLFHFRLDQRVLEEPDQYIKPFDIIGAINYALPLQPEAMIYHLGVYLGRKKVCHIYFHDGVENEQNVPVGASSLGSISGSSGNKPWIRIDDLERFKEKALAFICFHTVILSKEHDVIVRHLRKALQADYGRGEYNLITKNCEHFTNLIIHGINHSYQVVKIVNLARELQFLTAAMVATAPVAPISEPILVPLAGYTIYKIIKEITKTTENLILRRNDDQLFDNLEIIRELTPEEFQTLIEIPPR